jgi:hypothetical protein
LGSPTAPGFPFPVVDVCIEGGRQGDQEKNKGTDVDEFRIEIQAGEGIEDEFSGIRKRIEEFTGLKT